MLANARLSERSLKRLEGVHPRLVALVIGLIAVPAGLWPRLILLHCPYLALPIFPYSGYAAVKKSFHINIHYSFEAA